jgi:hypothetical protein
VRGTYVLCIGNRFCRVYYVSFFVKDAVDGLFAVVITVVTEKGDTRTVQYTLC